MILYNLHISKVKPGDIWVSHDTLALIISISRWNENDDDVAYQMSWFCSINGKHHCKKFYYSYDKHLERVIR